MSAVIRFVIVGSGSISSTYCSVLQKVDGVEIAGVVSRRGHCPDTAPDDTPVYATLAAVTEPYDAVILATPNGAHHAGAIEAAELGKHVLTEKVLDISIEAMNTMTATCEKNGVKLGVAFQRRMSPDNRSVKTLLDQGALGRVYAADLVVKFYRDQAYYNGAGYRGNKAMDGGGPFIQQAAHNMDIYTWFFGLPDKVVSMLDTFAHDIEGEDHGSALLRYGNGMIGAITASTCAKPGFPARLEIHAERGTVVLENDVITVWEVDGVENPAAASNQAIHSGASAAAVSDTAGHEAIVADFADAIRHNRDPAVPPASARLATELILAIYRSNVITQA